MNNRFETFTVLISSVNRCIRQIKAKEMEEYGLKSPHVSCLYYLYKHPSMTAAELCELCEEDKAAVSRSLLHLTQRGFLTREGTSSEALREGGKHYRSPLRLTEEGNRVAQGLVSRVDRVLEAVSEGVSEEERVIFYRTLAQINRNLRALCRECEEQDTSS